MGHAASGLPGCRGVMITAVHFYTLGLFLTIASFAFLAVIIVLAWYMMIVDHSFEWGRGARDILRGQYRQHRGVLSVQALCLAAAAVTAVLVPILAPK